MSHYEIRGNQVYCVGRLMRKADASSFVVLSELYARDCNYVYVLGKVLKDAVASEFEPLPHQLSYHTTSRGKTYFTGGGYGRDGSTVFWYEYTVGRGMKIRGADPVSFEFLGHEWGRDEKHVYYMGRRVKGAKPRSFNPVGRLYGQCGSVGFYGNGRCDREVAGNLEELDDLGIWAKDEIGFFLRGETSTEESYLEDSSR